MKIYKVKFIGRHRDAIRSFVRFSTTIKAENVQEAILKLYENYQDIQKFEIREVK